MPYQATSTSSVSSGTLENPYLERYLQVQDRIELGYSRTIFNERAELCLRYSWAIPNEESLEALVDLSPLVEIGAGGGYWAALVAARGGYVYAYDSAPSADLGNKYISETRWFPVSMGGSEKAADHPGCTLFLCWPPYEDPMATHALEHFRGEHVVFIGESLGGCTADDAFFTLLEKEFSMTRRICIPTWQYIHDQMTIWKRRKPT
jgi:hypothetical protein